MIQYPRISLSTHSIIFTEIAEHSSTAVVVGLLSPSGSLVDHLYQPSRQYPFLNPQPHNGHDHWERCYPGVVQLPLLHLPNYSISRIPILLVYLLLLDLQLLPLGILLHTTCTQVVNVGLIEGVVLIVLRSPLLPLWLVVDSQSIILILQLLLRFRRIITTDSLLILSHLLLEPLPILPPFTIIFWDLEDWGLNRLLKRRRCRV